jgi:hypothetical protein
MPRFFQLFIKKVNIGLFRLMNGFQGRHNSPYIHELLGHARMATGAHKKH